MKIEKVEMLHVDAGWRPWSFIKITTNSGPIGWSECTDSHGSPRGMAGVVQDLEHLLIGQDPRNIEKILWELNSRTRQSPGSIIQKAIGGIENALWDIKAKDFGVPVYQLFGGAVRTEIPLYWSHCATSRVRAWEMVQEKRIVTYDDVIEFAQEVKNSGFKAIKTNIGVLNEEPHIYMPGFFKSYGGPQLNADKQILIYVEKWIAALREGLGESIDIALDLNFNFKTEGCIKIGRLLESYDLAWLEIDSYDPLALRQIKDSISTSIVSCENLYGPRQYKPYFENHAMDIASIDVIWNGFSGSKKIADLADIHEMNVCPHNYNGHLSSFISLQFCAVVPNFRIAEIDVDDVPWRDELFTEIPTVKDGKFYLSDRPGWGTDVNEKVIAQHPWPK